MKDIKNYENMTIQEKWNMLATVANLYYNSEMTQNEIAARMYTSRSKISRMLKEARELGIVEISIKEPWERDRIGKTDTGQVLCKEYKGCHIKRKYERTGYGGDYPKCLLIIWIPL